MLRLGPHPQSASSDGRGDGGGGLTLGSSLPSPSQPQDSLAQLFNPEVIKDQSESELGRETPAWGGRRMALMMQDKEGSLLTSWAPRRHPLPLPLCITSMQESPALSGEGSSWQWAQLQPPSLVYPGAD